MFDNLPVFLRMFAKTNPTPINLGIFLLMAILLVAGSMFISNTYEDFLNDGGDISNEMMEMPIQNFLMLYMPQLMSAMIFLGGIVIFSGAGGDGL